MIRTLPLLAALALAGCVSEPAARAPSALGEVQVGAESYPIEAVDADKWRVMVDGRPVLCLKPEAEACYWSVRHYLLSRETPDVIG